MLLRLRLESFLVVEEADLSFAPGLNVVTGETGTGKSILIDALGFLVGGRGDADWIRAGAELSLIHI
ncbi:MAG: AAA family ATPase [Candidatus Eisenbacteria bacterium]|nr:AAA family ATPase [Candidatus Eisenbacteria bacterium]